MPSRRGGMARVAMLVGLGAGAVIALTGTGCVLAQTSPAEPTAAAPAEKVEAKAEDFAGLYEQWVAIKKQRDNLARNYRDATPQKRREIIEEYEQLAREARTVIEPLFAAARASYEAAPNADPNVVETLIECLARELTQDRLESAWQLGKWLEDNGCEARALPALLGETAYALDKFDEARRLLGRAQEKQALTEGAAQCLEDLPKALELWSAEQAIREQEAQADNLPRVRMETSQGTITLELFENEAPQTVGNFVSLVESGFYNGLTFHRVLPGFMAQGGCPEGTGRGGPGYRIYCECNEPNHRKHFRGVLSMAKTAAPNTGGSQFFLTFRRTPHLDGRHTVFGRVIEGHEVLAKLERRDPTQPGQPEPDRIVKAEVLRKRDHVYAPTKVPE